MAIVFPHHDQSFIQTIFGVGSRAPIIALSGAPKGSHCHYFPDGKLSIAEAAVRQGGHAVTATLRELARTPSDAGQARTGLRKAARQVDDKIELP